MKKIDHISSVRNLFSDFVVQYMFDFIDEHPEFSDIYICDDSGCAVLIGHYLFLSGNITKKFINEMINMRLNKMGIIIVFYLNEDVHYYFHELVNNVYDNNRSLYINKTLINQQPINDIIPIVKELEQQKNFEMIKEEIIGTNTYASMTDFYQRGIGFTTIKNDQIIAFCTSEYQSTNSMAIGIEVDEEYLQKGIGTDMTTAFVKCAKKRNIDVYWECWKKNIPSVKTALKCGFEHVGDYPVLFIRF